MATLQPGGAVKAKTVIMTVVQARPLQLRVAVPEASLRHLQDQAVWTVSPVAYPDAKLQAKVRELSEIPIANGIFDAVLKVDVSDFEKPIVPGMKAKLTFTPEAE